MLWENDSQVVEPYEKSQQQIIRKEANLSPRKINAKAELRRCVTVFLARKGQG